MKTTAPNWPRRGFSLIELLTVIAIIAVLMALMFPAIIAQQSKSRRSACSANLAEIAGGIRMYHLDMGSYPPALLGFVHAADEGTPGNVTYGLYPHYVKSTTSFICPNNPATRRLDDRASTRLVNPDGTPSAYLTPAAPAPELRKGAWVMGGAAPELYPSRIQFPVGDSYDVSVMPTTAFGTDSATWERHYALQWLPKANLTDSTQVQAAFANVMGKDDTERARTYARQLVFRRPDDATVVTVCTYHRDYPRVWSYKGRLLTESTDMVLFLDGHVEGRRSNETNVYDPAGNWAGWQVYPNQ